MRLLTALLLALMAMTATVPAAHAEGERAGDFAYYVLSLSWSPNWCLREGDARRSPQCAPGHSFGFTLHGLWPQYARGYPSYCHTAQRDPSRGQTAAMADITGAPGLAWHEWKKHGRCTGLSAAAYFAKARAAYESVHVPAVFTKLRKDVKLPARVVEQAFLEANPQLKADMVTITCNHGMIGEVRVCLTKDLQPRSCGPDVVRDCRMTNALMDGLR